MDLANFGIIYLGIYLMIGFIMSVILYVNEYIKDYFSVMFIVGMWAFVVVLIFAVFIIDKLNNLNE